MCVTLSCSSATEPGGGGGGGGNNAVSRELSTITAAPSSIVANGTSTATITVALRQTDGSAYAKSGGVVALTASSGTVGSVTDLGNGTYAATLTSSVTAGAAVISGTLAGASLSDTAGITYIAGSPAAITSANASANSQTAVAGSLVPIPPSVKITDAHNNPVSGITVTFSIGSGGGSITGASPVTDAAGVATIGSWTLGPNPGPNTLVATVTLPASIGSALSAADLTVTFTATGTAREASNLAIFAGNNQTAVAGTAVAVSPSVKVTDINGGPIAGVSITFAIASGGGSIASSTSVTDGLGVATSGSWTLGTTAGSNTITASITGSANSPVTFTATGTAGPPAIISINGGNNQSALIGTAVATPPSVKVTDANGNPIAGAAVTFAVSLGGGSVSGGSTTTNASGIATVGSWTLGPTAGPNTLTATSAGANGSPVTFSATGTATAALPSIVFELLRDGNYDIWRVNLDGTGLQQLTTNVAEEHHPSSAGGKVYFSSVRDGNSEIYRMDASAAPGSEVRVTNDTLWQTYVQISPNAQRLAFLQAPAGAPPQAYYSPADASNPQRLAPGFSSGSFEFDVAWSQASDKIAFSSNESFPIAVYIATPGSAPAKPGFNSVSGNKFQPTWGPDGRIAYLKAASGSSTSDLVVVDPVTGASTTLLTGRISEPTWLPNNIIVYATYSTTSVYSLHWIDPANPSVVHDIDTGTGSARYPSAIFP
jgi:hypothetical protein